MNDYCVRCDRPTLCLQMEEGSGSALRPAACRAKGGAPGFKVAVLGAAGGIGQSLSLLMKMNPLVSVLHLYDVVNTPGVTADVSHMDTSAVVKLTYLPTTDPTDSIMCVPVIDVSSSARIDLVACLVSFLVFLPMLFLLASTCGDT